MPRTSQLATSQLAAASRDSVLALRRVERQQALIERLHSARRRIQLAELAHELGVSARTAARDVERLREGGLPLDVRQGRGGGVALRATTGPVRPGSGAVRSDDRSSPSSLIQSEMNRYWQ